jgi:hypothetical protein
MAATVMLQTHSPWPRSVDEAGIGANQDINVSGKQIAARDAFSFGEDRFGSGEEFRGLRGVCEAATSDASPDCAGCVR